MDASLTYEALKTLVLFAILITVADIVAHQCLSKSAKHSVIHASLNHKIRRPHYRHAVRSHIWFWLGVVAYLAVAFLLVYAYMRHAPSHVHLTWTAASTILFPIVAYLYLGHRYSGLRLFGIALILAGVLISLYTEAR